MKFSFIFYEPIDDLAELSRRLRVLGALGYSGVELSLRHAMPYASVAAHQAARDAGLSVVSTLSGWSYVHEGLCLSVADSTVRDRAVARLGDYLEYARGMDCPFVVVGLMQGTRADEPDVEAACGRIADCLARAAKHAERIGVRLLLEPVNHLQVGFHNTAAAARALVERVASPGLGFMLDTFHMNIEENSISGGIYHHQGAFSHIHLCETTGGRFGSGHLNIGGVLGALGDVHYEGFVSVKVYREPDWEAAARSSAEFLRGLGVL